MDIETRVVNFPVRSENVGDVPHIKGVSPVYETMSEDLGGWREIIHRGAFTKSIQENDIRATWNHDTGRILGRVKSGTLKLDEREDGVHYDILPPTSAGDIIESISRGDVDQASFGFRAVKDQFLEEADGLVVRHIYEGRLFTIDPCAIPAYAAATSEVRSAFEAFKKLKEVETAYIPDADIRKKMTDLEKIS
jgi:hypothetical protein